MRNNEIIKSYIKDCIENHYFSACDLLVSKGSEITFHLKTGYRSIQPDLIKIENHSLFDIASLTKPMVVSSLFLCALQDGKVDIHQPLSEVLKSYPHHHITFLDLLNHQGRQIAYREYEKLIPPNINSENAKSWLFNQIKNEDLIKDDTLYSDNGFILLGFALEKIYCKSLDLIFLEKIAHPLGLKNSHFNSSSHKSHEHSYIASQPFSKEIEAGIVMDPRAQILEGVSGHAGLFSDAKDIHKWLSELRKSYIHESRLFDSNSFKLCLPNTKRDLKKRNFYFGFESKSIPSTSGSHFSNNTIGHLGYTGCSFWWDLDQDFWIILLTNRIFHQTHKDQYKLFRPHLHNLVYENIL